MDIKDLKIKSDNHVKNLTSLSMQIRLPVVTDENEEQYKEWLRITEELGIGFGKYA